MLPFKKSFAIIFIGAALFAEAQNKIAWNSGFNISANTYGNMHPRISLDRKGNPLLIWGRMSDQAVLFSRWNGTAFTVPVKLNPPWLTIATASWMGPDIASKGDTVYVVMKRTPEASDTNHIYLMSSFNGGVSFNTPVRVDFIADSISRFPTVETDLKGNPLVAFMKFNKSFLKSRWVVAKSDDYGKTFLTDIKASGYSGPNAEVCDCCPGAIASSGNVSAVVYRDNLNNKRDIWTGISKDNNLSFPNGFSADNTNWMISSCPASGPDAVIIGDSVYTVFLSGATGNYRTYLSKSSINTGMVGSVKSFTGAIAGLGQQNYPRIAANGKFAAIVWKQTVNAVSQLPILFTNNIDKGFYMPSDTVDIADITNTDIAMSRGNIYVVWQDDKSGTVKFRSGTFNPFANNVKVYDHNLFSVYPNPANDFLYITPVENTNFSYRVTNAQGQLILASQSGGNIKLETSDFPAGVYFIQIISNNRQVNHKFIKQ